MTVLYSKDELMSFSSGSYSDYSTGNYSRVLKDITKEDLLALEKEVKASDDDYSWNQNYKFYELMKERGFIEDISMSDLYTGDYNFELDL